MGSRFPSHKLSNSLYVRQEKTPIISSVAMPYTGGDIKKSELGKMFDIPMDGSKSRKSGPITGAPSRTGSFGGAGTNSGPIMPSAAARAIYTTSGPVSRGISGSTSLKKSNSEPLNKHGEPIKKSSGGVTRQNFGPIPPNLPATGLITSDPISSGPLNLSRVPRKIFGPLDSMGPVKMHGYSIANNHAITTLSQDYDFSFRGTFPKPILWSVILIFVMGFIAGGFILGVVHNVILLIVVVVLFVTVAALFTWNTCWGRKAIIVSLLVILMQSSEL